MVAAQFLRSASWHVRLRRIGAKQPIVVDTRVICATHKSLSAMVGAGKFREDLYFRLCEMRIELPPLRERQDDLRLLIRHFLKALSTGAVPPALSPEAEAKLLAHPWPGNVRELGNVMQRCFILKRGLVIQADEVMFDDLKREPSGPDQDACANNLDLVYVRGRPLEDVQNEAVLKAWRRNGGVLSRVVQELGVAKNTVYRYMEALGIPKKREE